ncbi:Interferon-induced 6-16 family [Microdochium nivale]|nr:Interferon-induced 6-16 family [Microdochium nivale]
MLFGWLAKAARTALAAVKSAAKKIWEAGKAAARAAIEAAEAAVASAKAAAKKHPVLASVAAAALFTVIIPCVAVGVVLLVLKLIGFGPAGVCAGSAAAAMQASIGSVTTPSLFATCTSAAAGGYGLVTMTVVVQLVATAVAVAAAAIANMMD